MHNLNMVLVCSGHPCSPTVPLLLALDVFQCPSIGFPHCSVVKNLPAKKAVQVRIWSLGAEDPLEKKIATHSSILPGKSHGQRSLAGLQSTG